MRYVVRAQGGPLSMAHELQRLFQDLGQAVVDVASQLFDDGVRERGNAHRFANVAHVVRIPDGRRHCAGFVRGVLSCKAGGRRAPRSVQAGTAEGSKWERGPGRDKLTWCRGGLRRAALRGCSGSVQTIARPDPATSAADRRQISGRRTLGCALSGGRSGLVTSWLPDFPSELCAGGSPARGGRDAARSRVPSVLALTRAPSL